MSRDSKPRLVEEGTPFERQLLQASDDEAPAPELERKILAAVAAAPAGFEGADSSQIRAVRHLSRSRFVRPVAVATISLGLLVGGVLLATRRPASPAAPAGEPAGQVAKVPTIAEPPVEVPTVTPEALPTAPATPTPAPPPGRPRGVTTSQNARALDNTSSLEREIALLDSVKAKLGAGAAVDAANALDTYDAEFPQGALRPEATLLRIRTLLLQGKRPEAQKLADDFLAKHPSSVHAKRIRVLLADGDEPRRTPTGAK